MLMKRRSLPFSSLICVLSAGKDWSISASRPGRFSAAESKFLRPSVWRVKAAGRNTLTDMCDSSGYEFGFNFRGAVEFAQVCVEIGEAGTHGACIDVREAIGQ